MLQQNRQSEHGQGAEVRPHVILFVLASMFMIVYLDRGAFASSSINGKKRSDSDPKGSGFQGEFDLNNLQDGILASLFMIGVLVGSPIFSQAVHHYGALRLVGVGTLIWMIAVACCTIAQDFYTMALFRIFVGFGEGALLAIGPTYIGSVLLLGHALVSNLLCVVDDRAPKHKVALWLGVLFLAIPCGFALGFVFGAICESILGWRCVFPAEAILMSPFLVYCFMAKPIALNIQRQQSSTYQQEGSIQAQLKTLWVDICTLFSHPVFTVSLLASIVHTGVLGVLAYFGAKAAEAVFHKKHTDVWIGGVVLISGLIGILSGGAILDRRGSSIPVAMIIAGASNVLSAVFMIPPFLFVKDFIAFIFPFTISFIFLFVNQAPVAAVSMWSVPLHLRPLATSTNIILIHVLGDLPSPALCGALLDFMEDRFKHGTDDDKEAKAYRIAFTLAAVCLFVSASIYFIAARLGRTGKNYRLLAEQEANLRRETEPLMQTPPATDQSTMATDGSVQL